MTDDTDNFDVSRFIAENALEKVAAKPAAPPERPRPVLKPVKWDLPGFHGRARVSTSFGDLPIMGLRRRDRVKTINGTYKEVKWIDQIHVDVDFLSRHPEAQPVLIRRGALAKNSPEIDIHVSPAQELVVREEWTKKNPVMAGALIGRPSIFQANLDTVTYYLFHCEKPEIVLIEGAQFQVSP